MSRGSFCVIASVLFLSSLAAQAEAQTTVRRPQQQFLNISRDDYVTAGRVEFSTAAGFQSTKIADDFQSTEVLNLPLRLGYFFADKAELEGELFVTHAFNNESDTGISTSARAVYHIVDGRVAPFAFAGLGLGNAYEILDTALDTNATRLHFEVGGGVKVFFDERVALRADYRFARFSDANDSPVVSDAANTHRVFVGFSLFSR